MSQGPLFHFVLPFEDRIGAQAQGLGSECGWWRVRAWLGSEGGFGFLASPFHLVLSKKGIVQKFETQDSIYWQFPMPMFMF